MYYSKKVATTRNRKAEIKKEMAESQETSKISAILEQVKGFFTDQ